MNPVKLSKTDPFIQQHWWIGIGETIIAAGCLGAVYAFSPFEWVFGWIGAIPLAGLMLSYRSWAFSIPAVLAAAAIALIRGPEYAVQALVTGSITVTAASIYLSKGSLKKVFWFVGSAAFINAVLFLLVFPAELRTSVERALGSIADFILNHGVREVPDITETALFELQSFGANLVMLSRQPVLYVLISVTGAFTAFFGGRLLEKFYFLRRQNKIDFTLWQVPDMFIWVFLGSVIIVLATMLPEMIPKLQNLSENPVVLAVRSWFVAFVGIGFLIYSVQGVSVLVRLLAQMHIAMPLLSIGLVLFFIVMWFLGPPAYDVVVVLLSLFFAFGLFDLFFDFRKIHHRRQTDESNQA